MQLVDGRNNEIKLILWLLSVCLDLRHNSFHCKELRSNIGIPTEGVFKGNLIGHRGDSMEILFVPYSIDLRLQLGTTRSLCIVGSVNA